MTGQVRFLLDKRAWDAVGCGAVAGATRAVKSRLSSSRLSVQTCAEETPPFTPKMTNDDGMAVVEYL
jgi:hypothetical protein